MSNMILNYFWFDNLNGHFLKHFCSQYIVTNLSNCDNLSDTICCGPWMAACSQYSLTCWSINLQKFIILLKVKWWTEKILLLALLQKMISIFMIIIVSLHDSLFLISNQKEWNYKMTFAMQIIHKFCHSIKIIIV